MLRDRPLADDAERSQRLGDALHHSRLSGLDLEVSSTSWRTSSETTTVPGSASACSRAPMFAVSP